MAAGSFIHVATVAYGDGEEDGGNISARIQAVVEGQHQYMWKRTKE